MLQRIPNDYDGDGRADVAIYRPSVSEWWLNPTTAGTIAYLFGANTDKIVPGLVMQKPTLPFGDQRPGSGSS